VASPISQGGRLAQYRLNITFLMLPTKNCKRAFEFVKVIIENIVSFFRVGYNRNGIFNDVIITSIHHSDK